MEIVETINAFIPFILGLAVLVLPIFVIIGIVMLTELKNIADADEKKKRKSRAMLMILSPFMVILFMFILVGILNGIDGAMNGVNE